MSKKEDLTGKDFVGHILQAADRILQYTKGMSREEFFADTLKQDAVIRNIAGELEPVLLRYQSIRHEEPQGGL